MTRICFVADYPKYYLGGAERQTFGIAILMAERGHETTLVTKSLGRSHSVFQDSGVTIREVGMVHEKGPQRSPEMFLLLANLLRTLKAASADVYYQRTASAETGLVAFACERMGKPFVFGSSSILNAKDNLDGRLHERTPLTRLRLASLVYTYGLGKATAIVAQTSEAADLFRRRFPGKVVLHVPPIAFQFPSSETKSNPPFVFCVSRLVSYRSPLLFLELAKTLPDIRFVLAGYGPMEDEVRELSSRIPNVEFKGRVSPSESNKLMTEALLYVNTSSVEGFPNTLLEAASAGTPYVAFFDPDEVICKYSLGFHVSDFAGLVASVEALIGDSSLRDKIAKNGRIYIRTCHDKTEISDLYSRLFSACQGKTGLGN